MSEGTARGQGGAPDVAATGEFGLIAEITRRLPLGNRTTIGPGDDAAVIDAPTGQIVISTDMLVEDRHFRRSWSSAADVGHKAAAQTLSDIAAMGARPTSLLVALAVPADLPAAWVLELADGVAAECTPLGVGVIGGDVTSADRIVIAGTALGEVGDGLSAVRRGGARDGDVVAVCGRLGWAAAGLAVLGRGFRSPRAVVSAHQRPLPPYEAGPEAARLGATAMIDVSDGLLQDLGHVARASGVSIDVDPAALEIADPLRDVGAALNVDPLEFVLTGGEDHALAACFPPGVDVPGWRVIGAVRASADPAVTVDGRTWPGRAGWDHFR
jgi:thiamine-monophosphate kinase